MESQWTTNNNIDLFFKKKKKDKIEALHFLISKYITKISNENSKVLAGIKTDIQTKGMEQRAQK